MPLNCDLARVFSHTASPCVLAANTTTAPLLNTHLLYNITMHTSEYDYLFKLLLIGDSGVGKVCDKGLVFPLILTRVLWSTVLSIAAFRRRHIHRELYQHHRRGLQDSDY